MNSEMTVYVVDDDPDVRDAVSVLLGSAGYRVESFDSAESFLSTAGGARKGCVVADVRMPGMNGLDLQDRLSQVNRALPIIFITGYGEVPSAVRAMKGGAVDFIQKPFSDAVLLDRIREALDRVQAANLRSHESDEILSKLQHLTEREREVLDLVVEGQSTKQIASTLGRAEKTVEFHRTNIMRKLDAPNVAALVRMVMTARNGVDAESGDAPTAF